MKSINKKFDTLDDEFNRIKSSMAMHDVVPKEKNEKFRYIWKLYGKYDGFDFSTSENPFTYLLPYLNSHNKLLNDLFLKYPKFSEKQWYYWNKIIDEIYYIHETPEGREKMKLTKEAFYWMDILRSKVKLNGYDDKFISNFHQSVLEKGYLYRPMSQKQIDVIMRIKKRYWRQLTNLVLNNI